MEVLGKIEREVLIELGCEIELNYSHDAARISLDNECVSVFRESKQRWIVYTKNGKFIFTNRALLLVTIMKYTVL